MTDEFGVPVGDWTWRAPLPYRVSLILIQSLLVGAATAYGWVTLWSNGLMGWVVLVVTVPLWGWLAFRGWTQSATLTQDTLVIRNALSTERVTIADITKVSFGSRQSALRVTEQRHPPSPVWPIAGPFPRHWDHERHTVTAIQVGVMASLSGIRCEADDTADLIAAAAGLPALPARKARVSHEMSLVMIPVGAALFTFGVTLPAAGHLSEVGVGLELKAAGALLFSFAVIAELGRFIQRRRT